MGDYGDGWDDGYTAGYNAAVASMRKLREEGSEDNLAPIGEYIPENKGIGIGSRLPKDAEALIVTAKAVSLNNDGTIRIDLSITADEAESPPGVYEAAQVQRNLGHH